MKKYILIIVCIVSLVFLFILFPFFLLRKKPNKNPQVKYSTLVLPQNKQEIKIKEIQLADEHSWLIQTKISETSIEQIHIFNQNGEEITYDYRYEAKLEDTNNNGKIDLVSWKRPFLDENYYRVELENQIEPIYDAGPNWRDYKKEKGLERIIWQSPVNYFDSLEKKYKPVSLTILPLKEDSEFDYAVERNNFHAFFKKQPVPKSIQFKNKGQVITYWYERPQDLPSSPGYASGNKFVYPEFYPSVDLVISVRPEKLLEEFVLKEYQDVKSLTGYFQINQNISFQINNDGSIDFFDKDTSEYLWSIPQPVMYLLNHENLSASEPTFNFDIKFKIEKISEQDNVYRLSKLIGREGQEWLKKVSYPIVIDAVTTTLYPTQDAFTYQAAPNTNYNTSTLQITNYPSYNKDIYIQFDFSSFSAVDTIVSSTLYLYDYYTTSDACTSTYPCSFYELASTWNEGTITWSNAPSTSGTSFGFWIENSNSGWVSREIPSSVIQNYLAGISTNRGWKIERDVTSAEDRYYSKDYSETNYRPYMSISYTKGLGRSCSSNNECTSEICLNNICVTNMKFDGVKMEGIKINYFFKLYQKFLTLIKELIKPIYAKF